MKRIAIVGAGLSGLVAARELQHENAVTVFEKSRGPGGRMATRYAKKFEFDHGAQYFTATAVRFQEYLQPLIEHGAIACWHARFAELNRKKVVAMRVWNDTVPHYVGRPRMNAIGKYLADGLDVRLETQVTTMEPVAGAWHLTDHHGHEHGPFDWVVCAMPAAQTAALAPAGSPLHGAAKRTQMLGCFSLMLGFDEPLTLPWQAALVNGADLSWLAVNSSKPGRPAPFAMVAHSTNEYAQAHIDDDLEAVGQHLLHECSAILDADCTTAAFYQLHRWRYANSKRRDGPDYLVDTDLKLAGCGDWFRRGRVEDAFVSGFSLAERMSAK